MTEKVQIVLRGKREKVGRESHILICRIECAWCGAASARVFFPLCCPLAAFVLPVALPDWCGFYFPWLNQPHLSELARRARDADYRRLSADAPAAQPAE